MARKLADSKLKTKQFLGEQNVAVPKTLAVIKKHEEITDWGNTDFQIYV